MMRVGIAVLLGSTALALAASSTAHAHLRVESHTSRHTQSDQKVGPCGKSGTSTWGSAKVYTYAPGETIKVEIDEYIAHPGWFRISFDDDGDDDFKSPKSIDPPSFMDNETVLMDNLDMHQRGGGMRSYDVELPDVECEKCTLQIIQVMLDKPPYDPQDTGAFSNDIYYACIDMQLKRADGASGEGDAAVTGDAGAPSSGADERDDPSPPSEGPVMSPPSGMVRDAGRASGGHDAGAPAKGDAGAAHDDDDAEDHAHDDDADDHAHDDDAHDEEDEEAEVDSAPADDGCAIGGARGPDATLMLGVLSLLAALRLRRRRTS